MMLHVSASKWVIINYIYYFKVHSVIIIDLFFAFFFCLAGYYSTNSVNALRIYTYTYWLQKVFW